MSMKGETDEIHSALLNVTELKQMLKRKDL